MNDNPATDLEMIAKELYPDEYAAIDDDHPMHGDMIDAVMAERERRLAAKPSPAADLVVEVTADDLANAPVHRGRGSLKGQVTIEDEQLVDAMSDDDAAAAALTLHPMRGYMSPRGDMPWGELPDDVLWQRYHIDTIKFHAWRAMNPAIRQMYSSRPDDRAQSQLQAIADIINNVTAAPDGIVAAIRQVLGDDT